MKLRTLSAVALVFATPCAMTADLLPPVIIDANGVAIGRATTSFDTPLGVYFDATGQGPLAYIPLTGTLHTKNRYLAFNFRNHVFFPTTDCSGPAWFTDEPRLGALATAALLAGGKPLLYIADSYDADPSTIKVESRIEMGICVTGQRHVTGYYKASATPTDLSVYVPPLTVR